MTFPCLVLEKINKRFSGIGGEPVVALDDVSLTVNTGEYVCLLGRSGSGKSTLLSVVAGLESPDSGTILADGTAVSGPDRSRMLMFQEAALFPWLDVRDNVLYGLNLLDRLSPAERLERADEYIEMVGLTRFRHFRIHELSGGMRQRTALARALAPDPEMLLMDEPFSALDAMTREQLYADMQRIWSETKKTILMVTHNVREAVCVGSRVVLMEAPGKIVGDETVSLPYPRSMNDPELAKTAAAISALLPQSDKGGASL
ncbi:ABC transporter ATP-binding protein [Oxalobacter sp. OttesenSCG-928-P03]|nr:ABC transporter ATP-binding protein [Oxalobacter sp. OttesenSCG-928-P03]